MRHFGGFLNRYDFAYAGREEMWLIKLPKSCPQSDIKTATSDISNIAKERINQIISFPKILKGAIEDVYQMAFRLLGNLENNN